MDPDLQSREALVAENAMLRARLARRETLGPPFPGPVAPELIGREVSTRIIDVFFDALKARGLPPEVLTEGTGLPAAAFLDPRGRVSYAAFSRMMDNVGRTWTPSEIEAIAANSRRSPLLRAVFVVGRLLYSVTEFYVWAFGHSGPAMQMMAAEDGRAEELEPGLVRLEWRMRPGYAPNEVNWLAAKGSLRGMAEAFGYGPAEVTLELLPDGVVFLVRVPIAGGRLAWARRSMGWLFTARSAGAELREARDDLHQRYLELRREVDARNHAEEGRRIAQREREELLARLQLTLSGLPLGCLVFDPAGRVTFANPAAERIFGPMEAYVGRRPTDLFAEGASRDAFSDALDRLLAGQVVPPAVFDNLTDQARPIRGEWHHTPLVLPDGSPGGVVSTCEDVTDRERSAGQLLQALKMEGIGRLAGGIAHDFNNLLSVVLGYVGLLEDEPGQSERALEAIAMVQRACDRGAALASQLLAFGRRKVLDPRVLDVDEVVASTAKMLLPLLGEDVEVRVLAGALGRVKCDPTGLEQILVNLAVNARDAMPAGGRLTFETRDIELDEAFAATRAEVLPGRYVLLAVTDSGVGMDAETRARAFEPFFTTKAVGKGTGLGLSTVYGLVRQSGGHVTIYSEPGHGTTLNVFLPRVDEAADPPDVDTPSGVVGGDETVLLVEDDEALRTLALRVLSERGYRVLVAATPGEALGMLAEASQPCDLLLTDVVMPGLTGLELSRRALEMRPDLPVLFTSGYAPGGLQHDDGLDPRFEFLAKPFSPNALANRVRSILDRRAMPG